MLLHLNLKKMENFQFFTDMLIKLSKIDFKKKGIFTTLLILLMSILILVCAFLTKFKHKIYCNDTEDIKIVYHSLGTNVVMSPDQVCQAMKLFEEINYSEEIRNYSDRFSLYVSNDTAKDCYFHYLKTPLFSVNCDEIKSSFYDICIRFSIKE